MLEREERPQVAGLNAFQARALLLPLAPAEKQPRQDANRQSSCRPRRAFMVWERAQSMTCFVVHQRRHDDRDASQRKGGIAK